VKKLKIFMFSLIAIAFSVVALGMIPLDIDTTGLALNSITGDLTTASFIGAVSLNQREVFLNLTKQFPGKIIQPNSYLRLEKAITNSSSELSFDVKKIGNEAVTERKLDRNDKFIMTALALFIAKREIAKPGKTVLQSYPNATHFGANAGFTVGDLEVIYNGEFEYKVGSTTNIEALPTSQFRVVPETQQSAAGNFSKSDGMMGVIDFPAQYTIHGNKSNELGLKMRYFAGIQVAATEAGFENVVVLMPLGFLVKNASQD
jgi:hypothetical protein